MHNAQFTIHNVQCIMHNYFSFIFFKFAYVKYTFANSVQSYTFFFNGCIQKNKKMHISFENAHFYAQNRSCVQEIYVTFLTLFRQCLFAVRRSRSSVRNLCYLLEIIISY